MMIALAWHTARARLAALAGTFLALALGVALLAAMALTLASTVGAEQRPVWFTRPDVVVAGADTVSVTTGAGADVQTETERTPQARAVPAGLVGRLSTVDAAAVVVDYAGPATAAGVPGDTAHPWSAAALHDHGWQAGGPPERDDQVVLTAPTDHRPGDRLVLQTALGPRPVTVSGVLLTPAPPAYYLTDPVAAALAAGRVDAVALTARRGVGADRLAAAVRAVVGGDPVRVLTGDHRRDAEPDPDADKLVVAAALLGTTSGLAGFVSIFVVAGTFGYAVAVRRREFGLLRAAGATPGQVRRLVLGEALLVGVLASVAGGALGAVLARPFAHWLARAGVAPASFTARFILWPVAAAFGAGLLVALLGAALAARRAARIRPVEALREAAVDRRAMTLGRWLVGLAALGGAVPLLRVYAGISSTDGVALFAPIAMLLVTGLAMLSPVLIPPLTRLGTAPLAWIGVGTLLARHSTLAAVRRTAATAAPVLATAGIAGATLAGFDTLFGTEQALAHSRVTASAVVVPAGASGFADRTVAALRAAPGVSAAVPVDETTVYLPGSDRPDEWTGRYVPGPDLPGVLRLPVVAGSLADLTGTGAVAVPAGRWRLGDRMDLWLADSTPVTLRVVAVLADQLDTEQTVLLPWALRSGHTGRPLADAVYLGLAPGAGAGHGSALATAVGAGAGRLLPTSSYLSAADADQNRLNRIALTAMLGLALTYTAIAIANTLVMATGARSRELATLRLSGATPAQVLRMISVEAVLVAGTGLLLAAGVTAIMVVGMRHALAAAVPVVRVVIPAVPLVGIALACLLIALLASLVPAALLLRRRPVELAGVRE